MAGRLGERGIREPTEVQRRAIPRLLGGEDLLLASATGTGKTFAYLLPFLSRLLEAAQDGDSPALLIVAPTYELCSQIKGEVDFLLGAKNGPGRLSSLLLIGSAPLSRQIEGLRKRPVIVVGSPGRLLELARGGKLRTGRLRFLVLDEADRLVSAELRADTAALMRLTAGTAGDAGERSPEQPPRQTIACSATLPPWSRELLAPFVRGNPEAAFLECSGPEVLRRDIEHWALFSESRRKIDTLRSFLAAARPGRALVFTGRAEEAGRTLSRLQFRHIAAGGLWGDMDKSGRKQALEDLRRGRVRVLVTTDLAARGLDIEGLSHIIALDVPEEGDAYIHRAGRTGRAGKRGLMVSIGDAEEMRRLARLEKRLGITIYPKELYGGKILAPEPFETGL
jgi:superfamily II DNA/RNA helicase